MLLDPDVFFAPSSVVDNFNVLNSTLVISIYSFPCCLNLKMACKKKCPDDKKAKPKGDTHSGRVLNKVNLWDVFVPAWNSSMTPKNIIGGFQKN